MLETSEKADTAEPFIPPPMSLSVGVPTAPKASTYEDKLKYVAAVEEEIPVDIFVKYGETLKLLAKWSDSSVAAIKTYNDLKKSKYLRQGASITIPMTPSQLEAFNEARETYHEKYRADYDTVWEVVGLGTYTVEKGDSVSKISKKFDGVPGWKIQDYNPTVDFTKLKVGEVLSVPLVKAKEGVMDGEITEKLPVIVQKGETLSLYSKWSGVSVKKILETNGIEPGSLIKPGQVIYVAVPEDQFAEFQAARKQHHAAKFAKLGGIYHGKKYWKIHTVKSGDSLWKLAKKTYDMDMARIKDYNQGVNLGSLKVGQKIKIPLTDKPFSELNVPM